MSSPFFKKLFLGLSTKERTLFAKRLSFLIKSGVPIVESLKILQKQSKSPSMSKILDQVVQDVSNGQFLSSSLAKFDHIFNQFAVNLIKIGEESGTLDENLNYLAEELKKEHLLRRKVIGAMVYPIFIIIATLGIAGLLTIYIFPKILPIFTGLNVNLPITTRILIFASNFLSSYGIFLGLGVVALFVLFGFLLTLPKFRYAFERLTLKIPLVGSISQNYHLANFCRTLGLLLKSDIRIVRAFTIAGDTTANLVYKKALHQISADVNKGEKMTAYMEKHPNLFPHILSQLSAIGEATGRLDETLMYLAELYENEVDELTKNLSTVIEPALMVFMGIIVGFIAVSIITPIYEITQHLNPR